MRRLHDDTILRLIPYFFIFSACWSVLTACRFDLFLQLCHLILFLLSHLLQLYVWLFYHYFHDMKMTRNAYAAHLRLDDEAEEFRRDPLTQIFYIFVFPDSVFFTHPIKYFFFFQWWLTFFLSDWLFSFGIWTQRCCSSASKIVVLHRDKEISTKQSVDIPTLEQTGSSKRRTLGIEVSTHTPRKNVSLDSWKCSAKVSNHNDVWVKMMHAHPYETVSDCLS